MEDQLIAEKLGSRPIGVDHFVSGIDKNNRWVLLAGEIHWEKLELYYSLRIPYKDIHPEVSPRTLIAAYIIKYKLKLSSSATIRFINENHYLQYFAQSGIHYGSPPITADLMRSIRDRFGKREWAKFRHLILHESFITTFGKLFFSLRRHFKKPVYDAPKKTAVTVEVPKDKELFDSLGLEYPASKRSSKSDKAKGKSANKINKRLRRWFDLIIWAALVGLVIGSLVLLIKESEFTRGKSKQEIRK